MSLHSHGALRPFAALLLATVAAAPSAVLAAPSLAARSEAQYQRDAAVCLGRHYKGDKDDCLSEASTAKANRPPFVVDPDPGRYARNVLKRCERLPEDLRIDCVVRMNGGGTTTGSVAGGGIYRELVTREPATVEPAVAPK
jgi:hypothetical protein